MEWEFTAEDVVKGAVAYSLEDFRRDLGREVRMNLGPADGAELRRSFDLIYDLCYALATGRAFAEYVSTLQDDPAAIRLVKAVQEPMQENVFMLGAILQRMIMDQVARGLSLDDAVMAADAEHRRVLGDMVAGPRQIQGQPSSITGAD